MKRKPRPVSKFGKHDPDVPRRVGPRQQRKPEQEREGFEETRNPRAGARKIVMI